THRGKTPRHRDREKKKERRRDGETEGRREGETERRDTQVLSISPSLRPSFSLSLRLSVSPSLRLLLSVAKLNTARIRETTGRPAPESPYCFPPRYRRRQAGFSPRYEFRSLRPVERPSA